MTFQLTEPILLIGLGGVGARLAEKAKKSLNSDCLLISHDQKDLTAENSIKISTKSVVNPSTHLVRGSTLETSDKIKKNMEFSYFDQLRNDLNGIKSLKKILVPSGGDYLKVQGKERHVCSYLKDFQFDPKRANDTIHSLSGGQRNRLLLAKVLANPKTGFILDEPTNDLDLDTMDLLTKMLSNFKGTLLIVSHDRDFLDQIVIRFFILKVMVKFLYF